MKATLLTKLVDCKTDIEANNRIENNTELNNEDFFARIYKITYLSKEEIQNKIKLALPLKYKTSTKANAKANTKAHTKDAASPDDNNSDSNSDNNISFIKKETYKYEECLNNISIKEHKPNN